MAFKIITDSASDVPQSLIKEYDLHVIPTPVTIEGVDYFDGDNIFPDDFYEIQAEGKDIKTYHISQYMFEQAFLPYAERGDEVLYICFSTGIAGTFQAANLAVQDVLEEHPDFKITIIDSKAASMGFGLIVAKLLQMQKNGAPKELIIEAAEFYRDHMKHAVAVRTLEYLVKGGRISKTSGFVGGALDIKPIIEVDENGSLQATEKVRGWNKALNRVTQIVMEKGKDLDKQVIGTVHGMEPESVEKVKAMLKEKAGVKGFIDSRIGCAIGAHIGPGTVGIVYLDEVNEAYDKYLD
ncbi:MAG: DegV family protein [Lachnospiraceae bacterium]|nr:DegV family protein [Lachnospiraceae bacterium]